MTYYVYIYFDWLTATPIYVGHGSDQRMYDHVRRTHNKEFADHLVMHEVAIKKISCLSREEAEALEAEIIAEYGRLDLGVGTLYNKSDGGRGAGKNVIITDETRVKLSTKIKERNSDPQYLEDHKAKMKAGSKKAYVADPTLGKANGDRFKSFLSKLSESERNEYFRKKEEKRKATLEKKKLSD